MQKLRFHKRAFSLLLSCALILLVLSAGIMPPARAEALIRSGEPMQYAVGEDCLWTVANGLASCLRFESGTSKEVAQLENVTHIASTQWDLVYLTETAEQQTVCVMDSKANTLETCDLPAGLNIRQIEYHQSNAYLLVEQEGNHPEEPHGHDALCAHENCSVYVVSMFMPDSLRPLTVEGWENESISAIAIHDGFLYAYSGDRCEACAIDLTNGEPVLCNPPVSLSDAAYIAGADALDEDLYLYALSYAEKAVLSLVNLRTGEKHLLKDDLPADCAGLRRSRDTLFTLTDGGKQLLKLPALHIRESAPNRITLVSVPGETSPRMKKALELFHERYPDYEVAFRYVDDPRVLATAVMAGTEGYDILGAQDTGAYVCSALLYKSGALEDLGKYEAIQAVLPEYLDMFGSTSVGGHLYGVPESIIPYVWQVNPELADALGVSVPEDGWTWEEFFGLAEKVSAYNREHGASVVLLRDNALLLPYFLTQYNCNTVDVLNGQANYEDPAFIALLEKWKAFCGEGIIRSDGERAYSCADPMEENLLIRVLSASYSNLEEGRLILPPVFDERTKYPVNAICVEINANSAHKEACAYFLACYLSPEALTTEPVFVLGPWLKDPSRYPTDNRNGFAISEANETVWRAVLENSVQDAFIGDLHRDQWNTLYPQLLEGAISAEQYAKTCQQRADMVLGE